MKEKFYEVKIFEKEKDEKEICTIYVVAREKEKEAKESLKKMLKVNRGFEPEKISFKNLTGKKEKLVKNLTMVYYI